MCSDCIIVTTRLCFGVSGLDPESTRSRMAYKNDKYSVTYFFSRRYYHDIIANLRTELREMPWSQVSGLSPADERKYSHRRRIGNIIYHALIACK